MIFKFLEYITPTWYFNLRSGIDHGYFPTINQLKNVGFAIKLDDGYLSEHARELDQAWCAFQSGYVDRGGLPGIDVWSQHNIPVQDEYRFVKKNFSPIWSIYILFVRLATFHSPIKEIKGFLRARKVDRLDYSKISVHYPTFQNFKSALIESNPLVSIIIPTLNRYQYLTDVFRDIERQTYRNLEVIVVDQSVPFQASFYEGWNFPLRFWYQEEKALWKARNTAIEAAHGELILLYDDDSLVEPDWIEKHLLALDFFSADLSSGVSISKVGAKVPAHYSFFRWSDQLDTGNVLIKRVVFEKIGLFDRQFEKQRMGDGEFGLRAYLAGFRNVSNHLAKRIHLKVGEGGLRQMGSWDGFRPKGLFAPRPVPSVLYFYRRYFGVRASILVILTSVMPSIIPYRLKKNNTLVVLAFIFIPLLLPLVAFQVLRSWKAASKKIIQGPLIDSLN